MLLEQLRAEVLEANLELVRRGLVLYTFGNASGVDREQGLIVIKPSGVDYDQLRPEHMVITDLYGEIVEGAYKPSSDLDTHTLLYREFPTIGAVVHTHSEFATAWAQAGQDIPALGTTHADYFHGPIPCTEPLTDAAIEGDYVRETGLAIVRRFRANPSGSIPQRAVPGDATHAASSAGPLSPDPSTFALDPLAVPACLVAGHAPFAWGRTPHEAAHNAVVLEYVARLAFRTVSIESESGVSQALLDRHYQRKHGPKATYGQAK